MQIRESHKFIIDRFVTCCQADKRVVAAFLGGSNARSTADEHSDLDLYMITKEDTFEDFCAGREAYVAHLGEPVFIEDFDRPDMVFFVLADGTEGELGIGRESAFNHIHCGPYQVLLDKRNILAGVDFPIRELDAAEQTEKLRRLIYWFWHDLSHFITAMGRHQLWWAYGQLDELRHTCVKLARFQHDLFDSDAYEDAYFKVDERTPADQLASLQATLCPMESKVMLQSAFVVVRYYQTVAARAAETYGITYPRKLEQVMVERLEKLRHA